MYLKKERFFYCFVLTAVAFFFISCATTKGINKKQAFAAATPFGLTLGMNFADIADVCGGAAPEYIENDSYYFFPVKAHPFFKQYIVFIDKEKGLYRIKVISDEIKTNEYGSELKNAFSDISKRVSEIYGKEKLIDKTSSDSIFLKDDSYWVKTISEGSRKYGAIWKAPKKKKSKYNLDNIYMYVTTQTYPQTGWIVLEYNFSNLKLIQKSQDDVF